jgi:hypothetical protein
MPRDVAASLCAATAIAVASAPQWLCTRCRPRLGITAAAARLVVSRCPPPTAATVDLDFSLLRRPRHAVPLPLHVRPPALAA